MSFDYSYVLPASGPSNNSEVREMFEDVKAYVNNIAAGSIIGTVNAGLANHLAYYPSDGNTIDDLAITASRALVSDINGLPTASSVTDTELGYVSGVTSSIQTQIDNISGGFNVPSYVTLGTSATLLNERVLTAGTAISLTDNGAGSTIVVTNIGVTSAHGTTDQITVSATTGSVTFSLPQDIATTSSPSFSYVKVSSNATLISPIYGVQFNTSPLIGIAGHNGASISGTDPSLVFVVDGTTVLRLDGNGSSSLSTFNGNVSVLGTTGVTTRGLILKNGSGNTVTITANNSFSNYSLVFPADDGTPNQYLTTDGSGNLSWTNAAGTGTVNSGTANQLAYYASSTNTVSGLTLITASRALVSDTNGLPVASSVTNTTLAFLDATSSVQTQLNAKATDSAVVHNTGTESVAGAKTFSSVLKVTATGVTSINTESSASSGLGMFINNLSNTSGGDSVFWTAVAGTSAGDPRVTFEINSGSSWAIGADNSNSDTFKVSQSTTLGTNDFLTITTGGVATFSGQLIGKGTATNDAADAGYIGEYIESVVGSTTVGTTGQNFDLTSITLTAGDWDVSGECEYNSNGATFTSFVDLRLGISTTAGNDLTGLTRGSNQNICQSSLPLTFGLFTLTQIPYRMSLTTSTTVYLKGFCDQYTVGSPKSRCRISARRVR